MRHRASKVCGVTHPLLYVYQIPDEYRRKAPSSKRGFPLALRRAATPHPLLQLLQPPLPLRNTSQYSGAGVVWAKVMQYPCSTDQPASADLFFVPVLNELDGIVTYRKGNKGLRNIVCPPGSLWIRKACRRSALVDLLEAVRNNRNVSYLSRRGGRDHILFTPREGTLTDSHPYEDVDFYDQAWGEATRLAVEEGAAKYDWPVARFLPQVYGSLSCRL